MREMFLNLKRYEVPEKLGGICPSEDPEKWIRSVIHDMVQFGIGRMEDARLTVFVPEMLLLPAIKALHEEKSEDAFSIEIGCEGVSEEDVEANKNFGMFTGMRPAASLEAVGCKWVLIGHSEERKNIFQNLRQYDEEMGRTFFADKARVYVDKRLNAELKCALKRNLKVLFCIGETAEQKGSDDPQIYEKRVKDVLKAQLEFGLSGIRHDIIASNVKIAYEPVWAIGPGKTPASVNYADFASNYIKECFRELYGHQPSVIYGGGVKEENAGGFAKIGSLDGGFLGLTRFSFPPAFETREFKKIMDAYLQNVSKSNDL